MKHVLTCIKIADVEYGQAFDLLDAYLHSDKTQGLCILVGEAGDINPLMNDLV